MMIGGLNILRKNKMIMKKKIKKYDSDNFFERSDSEDFLPWFISRLVVVSILVPIFLITICVGLSLPWLIRYSPDAVILGFIIFLIVIGIGKR